MPYAETARSPAQDAVLDAIAERADAAPEGAFAVLDLDGCLFDTRHRQVQIARVYAEATRDYRLLAVRAEHFTDWTMAHTLRNAGFDPAEATRVANEMRSFWFERFFSSEYVQLDCPMPGAVRFVEALCDRGVRPVYLTGRHAPMRAGTETMLRRCGFPYDGVGELITKPELGGSDALYKCDEVRALLERAPVVIALDNEPANVNALDAALSDALVVFVDTDHSPLPDVPAPHLPQIRGFLRTTDVAGG